MSIGLSTSEQDLVTDLARIGYFTRSEATLAVLMLTREHARPEPELMDILKQYPSLEDHAAVVAAVKKLKSEGWLAETDSYGQTLVAQAPDLKERITNAVGRRELVETVWLQRGSLDPAVRVVGPMSATREVYDTYLDLLRNAQREILLPMLATSPQLASVPILQERAKRGVRIKILLGAPSAVAKLRGETNAARAAEAIQGWKSNAKGYPSMQIRINPHAESLGIASCMLVDNHILRFDVYAPRVQRSLEGIMLEVRSPAGMEMNLAALFRDEFSRAWRESYPPVFGGKLLWQIRSNWAWWACILFLALSFWAIREDSRAVWTAVFESAAASFLVTALINSSQSIRDWFSRLVRS